MFNNTVIDIPVVESLYGKSRYVKRDLKLAKNVTENSDITSISAVGKHAKSRDLGKSTSLPRMGNMGRMPVRMQTSKYGDTTQHILYLRVTTAADIEEAEKNKKKVLLAGVHSGSELEALDPAISSSSTPYLSIIKNYQNKLKDMKEYHKSHAYKLVSILFP